MSIQPSERRDHRPTCQGNCDCSFNRTNLWSHMKPSNGRQELVTCPFINTLKGFQQVKIFVRHSLKFTEILLRFTRKELRMVIGFLIEHGPFGYPLKNAKLAVNGSVVCSLCLSGLYPVWNSSLLFNNFWHLYTHNKLVYYRINWSKYESRWSS